MSIESAIEKKIQEAMARGEFDNLEGRGKPLDLDAYFNMPEDLRMAFSILKSNQFVPEEIEILKDIATIKEKLKSCTDDAEEQSLRKELHDKSLSIQLMLERYRRKR